MSTSGFLSGFAPDGTGEWAQMRVVMLDAMLDVAKAHLRSAPATIEP